jgi:hypothetical protein
VTCPQVRALLDVDVRPTAKLVLLALGLRAGTDGRAWPSVARLCADTGLSARAVRYAVQSLAEAGHLGVDHRPGRSLIVTVTAAPLAGVARHVVPVPRHLTTKSAAPGAPRIKKEELQEVATTGSTAMRPAAAGNTNGNGTGVVIHNGPAPGESWGEFRERGGR